MSARRQICRDGGRNALVQLQVAAIPGVVVEARNQMPRLEARRLDGILARSCGTRATSNIICSRACSWLSPPGVESTPNGLPSADVTSVGLSVTRGRLPRASSFGLPGTSTKLCARSVSGMPVSPAITLGSHAPEGVAENIMPSLSIASTQVVSCAISTGRSGCAPSLPPTDDVPLCRESLRAEIPATLCRRSACGARPRILSKAVPRPECG